MKLLRLTATFGCLDHATLEFGPGLTLIEAPNGGGKSTWCAFLRTMLYGLDTRQRPSRASRSRCSWPGLRIGCSTDTPPICGMRSSRFRIVRASPTMRARP